MTGEAGLDPKMEIAHVLNMDVVEYSTLLITEQMRVLGELARIVKNTDRFRRAEAQGKLIRIPTGDGMLLIFFDDAEAPIECAIEVARAIQGRSDIHLRMGIHSGPVHQIVDVNDRANVAGAGVDMAQRIMDCGDGGHILLSKSVADDLAAFPRWRPCLHDLGQCEVKHGRKISLVNFYAQDIGNPALPQRCAAAFSNSRARSVSENTSPRRRTRIAAVAVVLLATLIAVLFWSRRPKPQPTGANFSAMPAKSIAVLPFENLSGDPGNAYFADGIQEEILNRLSKIADLKVISRTSTQRYKSAPTNLFEIAKQLGVAHILEGTVQKSAEQVRVNVQLINAQSDSHIWADNFDRRLTDIFAVETEIATKVADALQAKLSGRERRTIASRPTDDPEAHQLYLKGRYFWGKRTPEDVNKAIDYFNQALARDANFAPAYVGLADSYVVARAFSNDRFPSAYGKALPAIEKALQIDNDLPEAHTSLAQLRANQGRLREAMREFEHAIALNPNYATAHHWFAINVLVPTADFDRAISEIKRAIDLDPFSGILHSNLGWTYGAMRRYPEAFAEFNKARELEPNALYILVPEAEVLELNGQLEKAQKDYEKIHDQAKNEFSAAALGRFYALHGQRQRALQLLEEMKEAARHRYISAAPFAMIYLGLANKNEAIKCLQQTFDKRDTGEGAFLQVLKIDPFFVSLRGDPRFEKIVDEIVPPDLFHKTR
jgi:TolB-like protein/Tfp pilus assembly protein PilF